MRRLLATVVSMALAMTACSGDEEPQARPASPPPVTELATPSPSPQEESPPRAAFPRELRLVRVATLEQPLGMAVRPADPRLYVAQKTGQVIAIRRRGVDPRPVLDLADEVSKGGEQGLLGLAFSSDGAYLYTNHTDLEGNTRITEWAMAGGYADPGSRREVLSVKQPYSNHNGGNLVFGPDGYLYIGLGDGGSANDPMGNAQSLGTLLGKMLRIDPRPRGGRPYRVPQDNPFVGHSGARPEIWAFGLRNPWRSSFDRDTGDIWIGDVGQQAREEIDRQRADSRGGENYGWDHLEGTLTIEGEPPPRAVPPVFEYGRDQGGTVIGGYVYRGSRISGLVGTYVFGDLFNEELRALRMTPAGLRERNLGISVSNLVSFGEDNNGELYALSLAGPIFRIAPG